MVNRLLKSERPQSSVDDTLSHTHPSSAFRGEGGGDGVKHALSLPDLTTPLLDPASWVEVPPFAFASAPHSSSSADSRAASSSTGRLGRTIQSRRPFSPKLAITPIGITGAGAAGAGDNGGGDFRISSSSWSAAEQGIASHRQSLASTLARLRGRKKAGADKLNILVAGGKGAGKTR